MSKSTPKPHRLRVWGICTSPIDGEPKVWLCHESTHESKGAADRERRAQREAFGDKFSSATVEPV